MRIRKNLLLLVFFMVLILLMSLLNLSRAQTHSQIKLDPKRVPWIKLLFKIESFSADVTTQVQLESLTAADVEAELIKSPEGTPIEVIPPESNKITVNYDVKYILKPPIKTINHVWFNPIDATALGRIRLRRGNDDFKKVYRFTEQGVFRHQLEPKDQQETSKQPEQWTATQDSFYSYDIDQLGCHNVTERLVLIYLASALELSKSTQPISFCVFGRRQLFDVQLKPQGLYSLEVDFIEKKQHGEVHRQGKVKALKIAIDPRPLASDLDKEEDFSFLGFQEDIAIFIDSQSGLPIQISGKISVVGQVTIKLHEVWLR
jgi:hypothetical protein